MLLVAPEHEVEAMELVSRIGVAVADSEMTTQSEEVSRSTQTARYGSRSGRWQANRLDRQRIRRSYIMAEREGVGSVVYITGATDMKSESAPNRTSRCRGERTGKSSQTSVRNVKSLSSSSATSIPIFWSGFKRRSCSPNSFVLSR